MNFEDYINNQTRIHEYNSEEELSSWESFISPSKFKKSRDVCPEILKINEEIKKNKNFSFFDYIIKTDEHILTKNRNLSQHKTGSLLDFFKEHDNSTSPFTYFIFKKINNTLSNDKRRDYEFFKNCSRATISEFHRSIFNDLNILSFFKNNNMNCHDFADKISWFYKKNKYYEQLIDITQKRLAYSSDTPDIKALYDNFNITLCINVLDKELLNLLKKSGYNFNEYHTNLIINKNYKSEASYSLSHKQNKNQSSAAQINFFTVALIKKPRLAIFMLENDFFDKNLFRESFNAIENSGYPLDKNIISLYERKYFLDTITAEDKKTKKEARL